MTTLSKRIRLDQDVDTPFVLQEKWDKQMLEWILARSTSFLSDDGEVDHQLIDTLSSIQERLDESGGLRVTYLPCSRAVAFNIQARLFASKCGGGLQSVSGWVRRLCAHKFYHDLDIVNCYPVLLAQLAEKHDIDLQFLNRYVKFREQILEADMHAYPGLSRSDAKKQYLKIMFGSNDLQYQSSFIQNFKKEIEFITESFWRMSEFQHARRYAEANQEEGKSMKGSFLSVVIQEVERQIIDVAMDTLREEYPQYRAEVYVFDGFMVKKDHPDTVFPQDILERLAAKVEETTGFLVEFVEKSLQPTDSDVLHIRPMFNNFNVKSDWTASRAFSHIRMLASKLNSEPKPENVKIFCKKVVPILNRAFALVRDTKLLVAERVFDEHGTIQYTYRKVRDALEMFQSQVAVIDTGEKPVCIKILETWRDSEYALFYINRVFNPRPYTDKKCASPLDLNSFVGLNYTPQHKLSEEEMKDLRDNQLKAFWDHVLLVWCKGDEEIFIYVHNWLCSRVQRPGMKIEAAIILRSEQGAGKGVVVEKLAQILGQSYESKPASLEHITGQGFNKKYFERCLVMFLDEAFYAGSKATKNQLKTKITDPYVTINEKFMPEYTVETFFSMILASNEDHVINREIKSRRYLCLHLDNKYAGVHPEGSEKAQYFKAIKAVDPQLLCDYMCSVDLDGWTGRAIPTTLEGENQAILSMSMEQRFVHELLSDPGIIQEARLEYQRVDEFDRKFYQPPENADPLEGLYVRSVIHSIFSKHVHRKSGPQKCFQIIKDMIPGVTNDPSQPRLHGKRARLLAFPELNVAREAYKCRVGLEKFNFDL